VKNHYDSLAKFVIEHQYLKDEWWSNEWGWVDDPREADIFSFQDTKELNLPIDGMWCKVQ
jgi:hypothetical protein